MQLVQWPKLLLKVLAAKDQSFHRCQGRDGGCSRRALLQGQLTEEVPSLIPLDLLLVSTRRHCSNALPAVDDEEFVSLLALHNDFITYIIRPALQRTSCFCNLLDAHHLKQLHSTKTFLPTIAFSDQVLEVDGIQDISLHSRHRSDCGSSGLTSEQRPFPEGAAISISEYLFCRFSLLGLHSGYAFSDINEEEFVSLITLTDNGSTSLVRPLFQVLCSGF
mmetsp:Transcript_31170/g.56507  ORF Transcript_31170/g.56507 Transcript_31170/m.56507 type:complete len:220 (-) Transcript_31170:226-885(-)